MDGYKDSKESSQVKFSNQTRLELEWHCFSSVLFTCRIERGVSAYKVKQISPLFLFLFSFILSTILLHFHSLFLCFVLFLFYSLQFLLFSLLFF